MANLHIDENAIMELVSVTHNPDGTNFDANVVLGVAEDILNFERATNQEVTEEKFKELDFNYRELPFKLQQLCFEIESKWLSTVDGHLTTICLLSTLSRYPWEAKMVLMLAALSISYGKLKIVSQVRHRKGLARQLALVRQITNPTETSNDQNALDDSIKCALDLIKCVVELNQSSSYSLPQSIILALPIASYWIGRSVASIAAYCACLSTTTVKLNSDILLWKFQNELNVITTKIKDILATCFQALEMKKAEESYKALQHALFNNSSNKLEVLKLILNVIDDNEMSLLSWGNLREKKRLNFYEDKKVVLLLTSGLDISNERIDFLNSFYRRGPSPYMLWIPIVDDHVAWATEQYRELGDKMWFQIVDDPQKQVAQNFIRFVNENLFPAFQIGKEPIVVSIDQQGRIVHTNAMHMILTWSLDYIEEQKTRVQERDNIIPFIKKEMKERSQGLDSLMIDIDKQINHLAREVDDKINAWAEHVNNEIGKLREHSNMYTSERETALWQKEKDWSLDLVVGEIDNNIKFWISQESYIFLYGGNDIKWVREFTSKVHEVSSKTQSNIQLSYVGKNDTVRASITKENMSHLLDSFYHAWWFWTRLQSALLSRINYLNATNCHGDVCDDEISQGFKNLLAYECKGTTIKGWALLSKGKKVILCGYGAKMLKVMNEYESWTKSMAPESFDQAFKDYYKMLTSCSLNSHHCCAFEYPITLKEISKNEKCPECSCHMQKFATFTCYHGDS